MHPLPGDYIYLTNARGRRWTVAIASIENVDCPGAGPNQPSGSNDWPGKAFAWDGLHMPG